MVPCSAYSYQFNWLLVLGCLHLGLPACSGAALVLDLGPHPASQATWCSKGTNLLLMRRSLHALGVHWLLALAPSNPRDTIISQVAHLFLI